MSEPLGPLLSKRARKTRVNWALESAEGASLVGYPPGRWTRDVLSYEATLLAAEEKIAELEAIQDRHLRLIRRLSTESISEEEALELRGQVASLIAEVGTLRAKSDQ